jgi:hypothetical protein
MLANTEIKTLICLEEYADKRGLEVLLKAGCIVDVAGTVYGMDT